MSTLAQVKLQKHHGLGRRVICCHFDVDGVFINLTAQSFSKLIIIVNFVFLQKKHLISDSKQMPGRSILVVVHLRHLRNNFKFKERRERVKHFCCDFWRSRS